MQLIPQSTTTAEYRRLYFTTVDVNNLQTRLTDAGIGAFTCKISKNGAAAVATTNSPTEVDSGDQPGVWYLELTSTEVNTLGLVIVTITAAEIEPREIVAMVCHQYGFSPYEQNHDVNVTYWGGTTATGTGRPEVNVTYWNSNAVATPTVAGVPEVDVTHWLGTAPSALETVTMSQAGGDKYLVPTKTLNPQLGPQFAKVSEATAARRRIFFWLHDNAGKPLTGVTWSSTGLVDNTYWLQLSKNGAAPVEAAGSAPTEVDATTWKGLYYYEATQDELDTLGRFLVQPYINKFIS